MKISLDNLDRDDDSVLAVCNDQVAARHDQTIAGCRWEAPGDMDIAYAIIQDHPGLVAELEKEGYDLVLDSYASPDEPDAGEHGSGAAEGSDP